MKILVTGKGGKSGSWAIRAVQLGTAIGAAIKPLASLADITEHDLTIVVKRVPSQTLQALRMSGKPWVYDLVDGWPQSGGCDWNETRSIYWLRSMLAEFNPTAIVYGTKTMQEDAGRPGLVLPHHSWQKYLDRTPLIRDEIRVVGYEGAEAYLGHWRRIVEKQCADRGWEFMINGDMRRADVGIALRYGGGYPSRWWKPGTKLSNLHALGIPAICSREAGYVGVASGTELWVGNENDLSSAFDKIQSKDVRQDISSYMRAAALPVDRVAANYLEWLNRVV